MKVKNIIILLVVTIAALFITIGCENETEKNEKYNYLVLVNKYTQLPDDWEKNVELVDAKNAWDEDIKIEKETYENYKKLEKVLKEEDNITIVLDSVYRSVKDQQNLWDEWAADPEKGIEYVKKFVAVPGYSEHHTGLAVDICLKIDGELVFDNDEMIEQKEIFKKIHARLADYGFILRYKEGREDSTGYTYEPWHLRYVGSTKIAKEIQDKDITFEEYLESIKDKHSNTSVAIYQVEQTLKDEFENKIYKDKIDNERFNVTRIYTKKEMKEIDALKSLKLSDNDIAFEVTYQLHPVNEKTADELMVVDGEYNKELGWVTNISRLGVLKYNKGTYSLENFGTGW